MKSVVLSLASLLVLAGCSDDSPKASGSSSGAPVPTIDAGSDSGSGQQVGPGAPFASYVILGDSISDRGGSGPFFYDLLADDLKAKLGDVTVAKHSRAGAVSKELPGQATSVPATLPGPVAVTVTIGGNDMQRAVVDILQNRDEEARDAFKANLTAAYDDLLRDGRFGEGVKVTIFHATIYDPTDGEGNFAEAGCPGYLGAIPKQSTAPFWDEWNEAAAEAVAKYGPAVVPVDIRSKFQGHGVGKLEAGTSWFAPDCIHPNTTGHDELRKIFFAAIAP